MFNKFFLKLFNKKKYSSLKYQQKLKEKSDFYENQIKDKIIHIDKIIKKYETINFLHSGHLGDIIYALPLIKRLSVSKKCNLFIQVNKKMDLYYHNHPSGNVMINEKTANLLLPLLKNQTYLNTVEIYQDQKIDINLDLFREMPFNIIFHSERWYSHLTGIPIKMDEKFLQVNTIESFKNKIIIVRSPRYRNNFINYKFLKDVKNLVCVGLRSEFEELKRDINHLEFHDCKDFLEMAEIINSAKFFLGNLGFAFSLAEGLKSPRLLEACPDFPVVFPMGPNAFDFYHQVHFENFFKKLLNDKT